MKGYKTVTFNIIMGALMMIRAMNPEAELPDEAGVTAMLNSMDAALTAVWGIGNLILRAVTNSPVFKK